MYTESEVIREYRGRIEEDRLCSVPDAEARSPSREFLPPNSTLVYYNLNIIYSQNLPSLGQHRGQVLGALLSGVQFFSFVHKAHMVAMTMI